MYIQVHEYQNEVYQKLENLNGVGVIKFANEDVVRHPLVGEILKLL
jgi:phosphate starvation-inducible protein PhoH